MTKARWRAWSCEVVVATPDAARLSTAVRLVRSEMRVVGGAVSRFDEHSEVSRIARSGATTHLTSATLATFLRAALWGAETTDGLLDPTLGRALVSHGYDRTIDDLPARAVRRRMPPRVDWRDVRLDGRLLTLPPGTLLDLGATAKALAADRAAERAAAATGVPCLVSIGGDLAVAGRAHPWLVAVTERPGQSGDETVTVHAGGVATSSVLARRWLADGTEAHHLLDPRTQLPAASPWRTATVLAASCLAANVASAATILQGKSAVDRLEQTRLPARLVTTDGCVVRTAAWPPAVAA